MPHRPRSPLAPVFLGTLLVLLSVHLWIQLSSVDSASSVVLPEVRERVLREGRVRVIAEMRLPGGPHVPEGLLSGAALGVQRSDIAGVRGQVLARLAGRTHRVLRQYSTVPLVALEVGPDALAELEASSFWVRRVVEDTINAPTLAQSVPLIGADQAWSRGYDGTGLVVAIVDTGVEATHPFLAGKVVEEACYSSNVTGQSSTVCPNGLEQQTGPGAGVSCSLSSCWHGTHVAGIAAGNGGGANVAFSGVAKGAQVMAVQVFSKFTRAADCGGSAPCVLAWTSDIIAGLERVYAVRGTRNLASANLSIGGGLYTAPCDGDPTKPIIDNLRSAGIAAVIAAGNNGSTNAVSAPGCISSAISVGATTKSDVVASYSNLASFVSLLAPGSSIYSSVVGGGYGYASGTSMATPHVAGTWAVLKQAAPSASVAQILTALQTTGLLITDTRSGGTVTKPRIRIDQALATLVPTVGSVTPNQGAPATAVPVTINGAGFGAGSTVSLSGTGVTVSNVTLVSATQLTATLTISATATGGARDVTVTNPSGGSGTLAGAFTVTGAAVTVTSMAPNQGTSGAAVPVTITGTGFAAGATVSVSGTGITVSNVSVGSATQITATLTIASGAALGARDITVTNSGGGGGTLAGGFTVVAPVTVTSITPNQGAAGTTVAVTVNGSGFGAGATLSLGAGITVSNLTVVSTAQITATLTIASGATLGGRSVTVSNSGGGSGSLAGAFTVVAPVTVSSVAPNQGAQGAAVPVTITGSGFATGAAVSLSGTGVTVSNVSVGSVTQITATLTIASGAALGARDITVTNSAGGGGTLTGGFTVVAPVTVVSLAPSQGTAGATVPVTVNGSGFAAGATLSLGAGITVSNLTVVSTAQITATLTIASGATLGGRSVTVTNSGGGSASLAGGFSVVAPVTVSSVAPNQGAQGLAVPVTITGSGFAAGATVSLSGTGVTASNVSVTSATQLTATLTIASGAALGARDLTVANSGGSTATLTGGFTIVAAVTLGSITPAQGVQGVSVPVTINGTGFTSGTTVTVSGIGVTASNVTLVSVSQLTATLTIAGTAALGTRDVTVTNSGGGTATLTGGFTVVAPVTVGSVAPNQGAQGLAVPVTIAGSGFASGATVSLSGTGVTASNVSVTSATQLTATLTIASGATLGVRDVTVTNSGAGTATLTGGFTIVAAVTLSSITPAQGVQGVSVPVTINGTGFTTGTTVTVSGAGVSVSNVTLVSASQLTATLTIAGSAVPGARDVTVTNSGGGTATLTGGFTVGAAVTVGSVTPNQGAQGAAVPVTITGSGFATGAAVSLSGTGVTATNVSVGSTTQLTATLTIASGAAPGARDVTVSNSGSGAATLAGAFTVTSATPASLTLAYNGLLRDRVGQGNTALAPDGALDGTLTATLSATGGRTVTALRLDSNAPGIWDTNNGNVYWVLGVAPTTDGALLNAPSTMAVNFLVADGGSFVLFAADYQNTEFLPGRTLTLTATFSDGSTATATTTVP